jgi:predicted short-subunit dehydrogenase-like oxidoreductase (DUF2520 family)
MKFFLFGPGKIGISLAILLVEAGHKLSGCWSRSEEGCRRLEKYLGQPASYGEIPGGIGHVDFVLITTAESALQEVSERIARSGFLRKDQILFHVSGVYSSEVLRHDSSPGIHAGSIHPVQAVASIEAGLRLLPHSSFTVDGDDRAVEVGIRLVEDIGGRAFSVGQGSRALYHCALSTASNFLVLLAWLSWRMLLRAGLGETISKEFVLEIMKGTHSNLMEMGFEGALTGPVLRGDWQTIQRHMEALEEVLPEGSAMYRTASALLLEIAESRGEAEADGLEKIKMLLRAGGSIHDDDA